MSVWGAPRMITEIDTDTRGLPAPLFGVMTLPNGISQGFITVTLGYVLTHQGFSVAAVAGMIGLYLLPSAWKFLIGPVLDVSLTPRTWYMLAISGVAVCLLIIAITPLTPAAAPLLSGLAFVLGASGSAAGSANQAVVALTIPVRLRGAIAGWKQSGNLGGTGIGGGIGLWISSHAGGPNVAAAVLCAACVVAALPILWVRTPPRAAAVGWAGQASGLAGALLNLARTRDGALAGIAVVLPLALGAAASLLPAVAGDWRASADLVAMMTGLLGGMAAIPGCLIGGYLCAQFTPRTVYMWAGLVCGLGEAAMALAPHTPGMFAGFVLLNSVLLGVTWGAVSAVTLAVLPRVGAATIGTVLSSLTNLPVVVVTVFVGGVQTRHGSTAMLLVEAGLAVAAVAAYSLLAWLWRPASANVAAVTA